MAHNAPIRQVVSNGVMFLVPNFMASMQIKAQKKAPMASASTPIPAPLLHMAITPVTCKIVHISQV